MFDTQLIAAAKSLLDQCRKKSITLVSAESCTGGLISGLLTEIAGSSDVFERGFVTYSNEAKTELLGVDEQKIVIHGAVSSEVAKLMAEGALSNSRADISIAVTGIAGPGGGSGEKPVGLVYIGYALAGQCAQVHEFKFGDIGRQAVRLRSVECALDLLQKQVDCYS